MCTWFEKRRLSILDQRSDVVLCSMHLSGWTTYKTAERALSERHSPRPEKLRALAVKEGVAVLRKLFQVGEMQEGTQGHCLILFYACTDNSIVVQQARCLTCLRKSKSLHFR